ncbi:MAG: cell division protein FtsZ, partial [Prevotellaceae bacterium]|nr:cell division protein FtsZ [Prevotellaceae bacterium]
MNEIQLDPIPTTTISATPSIIKVIGVGGGGGNAVNHMYRQGITDVTFVVCNTDNQDLRKSPVPYKIQLGMQTTEGLGAGAFPEIGQQAAEESIDAIKQMLSDNTKMVFITAGMGGGTGTGASPVIAKAAKEMGILTIAIVTVPFLFEGAPKIRTALEGVCALNEHVDAILVINNEKLRELYPDLTFAKAFRYADDVLANAAKSIAEIITITGYISLDFADVKRILKNGQVAVMNTGIAEGEHRITKAIENALKSPLLDNDISSAKKILLNFYCSESEEDQISMEEIEQINKFMKQMSENIDVIWGITFDNSLGKSVKVTLIATGFDIGAIPGMKELIPLHAEKQPKDEQPPLPPTSPASTPEQPPVADKKADIDKAMEGLYGKKEKSAEPKNEPQIPVISLEDLNDYTTFKDIEDIPAWKRRG